MSSKVYFQEEQKLNQWWIRLLLIAVWLVSIVPNVIGCYQQIIMKQPWGDTPMGDNELILYTVFMIVLITSVVVIVLSRKMITKIDADGVWIKFLPFIREWKLIAKDEIQYYKMDEYLPKSGLKRRKLKARTWGKNRIFVIDGTQGIQLFLRNDKKVFVGTRQKQSAEYAMRKMMERENE